MIIRGKNLICLTILGVFLWGQAEFSHAKPTRSAPKNARHEAPTQEDANAYFASPTPTISAENIRRADELRVKTINSINDLLGTKLKTDKKFELYLRLGELYGERHDHIRAMEIGEYDRAYEVWQKEGKKGKEPKVVYTRSKKELMKSADAFRHLVTTFPNHRRTDAALYALAKTLGRLDNDNSIMYFQQLIKNHPKSQFIPDAHLAMGEFYFDRHQINEAMTSYKEAMKFKKSRAYPYAVYKLGWAYFNAKAKSKEDARKNFEKSLAAFKLTVQLSPKGGENDPRRVNLRKEAINDMILVWAELEDVDGAWSYFKKIGENEAFYDLLEKLGRTYDENGQNAKAMAIYSRLLKEAPRRENNPEVHLKLVDLHERSGMTEAVVKDFNDMTVLYAKPNSVWTGAHANNKALLEDASAKTERNLHRMAALFHQRGMKNKQDGMLQSSTKLYRLYLATYPNSKNSYDLRYYLADILMHFKKWEEASEEYTKVVNANTKDGKYLKDSALNAVVSINNLDAEQKYPKLPEPGKVDKPIPLPPVKQKLIKVMDNYVKVLPQEKDGHAMRFTMAEIYFNYGHYPQALERFEKLSMEIPQTKQGKTAVKVVLGYYTERKDWDKLIPKCRSYLANKVIAANGMKPYVADMLKMATYESALAYEKSGQNAKAAAAFMAYQKEFPTDKNADRAVYNASINYYKVADIDNALISGKLLLKEYPKSSAVANVMQDIAQTYDSLAEFEFAADYYERYSRAFPNEKNAPQALFNAALLYRGLDQHDQSINLFKRYVKTYPKNEAVAEALFEVATLNERKKDYPEAVRSYQRYLEASKSRNADTDLFAEAKIVELNLQYVDKKAGSKQLDKIKRTLTAKNAPAAPEARRIIAGVMFRQIEPKFGEFKGMRISSAKTLEKEVGAKQSKLVSLAKDYEHVIDIGSGEYNVAALYRLGEMHEDFAQLLFKAPIPEGASPLEIEKFKSSLEKVAFPLKEESVKFFEAAYKRSNEAQTFTEWTKRSYKKMTEIAPQKYPLVAEKNLSAGYLAHELKWEKSVAGIVE